MKNHSAVCISVSALLLFCTPPPETAQENKKENEKPNEIQVNEQAVRKADTVTTKIENLPVTEWTGKKFVLLEKVKMFRKFGYHLYTTPLLENEKKPVNDKIELQNHRLKYEPFANMTATVSGVEALPDGEYLVSFLIDSMGIAAWAATRDKIIEGLGFVEDLAAARKRWMGKTVFSRRRLIDVYDATESKFTNVKVSIAEPLKVTRVRWGIVPLPPKPLWLIVERQDGTSGIIPVHFSWTNVLEIKRTPGLPWKADLIETNPRETYDWDEMIWEAIETHRILTGMTPEQVRLAWGDPHEKIESDSSRVSWIFDRGTVVFVNDTLRQ